MLYNLTDTDAKTHPDFAGKVIGGYDFISDTSSAGDGDGRDANPQDNLSGLQGTHVGGTVAAATNNGQFGAGVNWSANLINVRALGSGGGTDSDIWEGALWAVGEPVAGIPNNANPAKVLNLSLGGQSPCAQTELSINVNGADEEAGVFSNYLNKMTNAFTLSAIQGTSRAAPHIAGVVSLMVGIEARAGQELT